MSDKTIRDYPINRNSPFRRNSKKNYLSKDRALSVSLVPTNSRSITGIHKITKEDALELIGNILKEKLGITKGGINVFKYIFNNLEEDGDKISMTFKVDFEECRDEIGYTSTQSVWYGLAELLDKDIIARSGVPGIYFLNPNFFMPTETIAVTEYYKFRK